MTPVQDARRPEDAEAPPRTLEALEAALAREQARAREIDHRAKNSLQLISSLLLLLSRRSAGEDAQRALASMHQRVAAIAAVHRGHLAVDRPERFDFTGFLREHAAILSRAAKGQVEVRLDLDACETPSNQAAALALIANELISNALAHAFPDGRPGVLTVRLHRRGEGLTLIVEDNGCGRGEGDDGFGLSMVGLLMRQLNATLALEDAQPGVRAVVTAP